MQPFLYKQKVLIVSGIMALFLFVSGKIYIFASAPTKEKPCTFIYPNKSDQSKPTSITILSSEPTFSFGQKGGYTNDASCLNKTAIYGIAHITSESDVTNAIEFAKENNLKVTSAGVQHSMGGQSFVRGGLVLNMKGLNAMTLTKETNTLTVQSGALWSDVQQFLDKQGLSVKAMQSINIFTVGGTLSVNAHGIAHDPGQIAPTVKSMRVLTADGTIVTANPTENTELFRHVLGGYGLFGVILDVDLEVVPNEMYTWKTNYMDYIEFPAFYTNTVEGNDTVGLMYGRISISPTSYLTETAVHTFQKTTTTEPIPTLQPANSSWVKRLIINTSKTGDVGKWIRWVSEKHIGSYLHTCLSRNEAMSQYEVCNVSRNQEMYDSMGYLKNKLKDTDILQEYFIPKDQMVPFIDRLREIVQKNDANLINVTIRIVHKDTTTALPYAKDDRFAFVLYFNQKLTKTESQKLEQTTKELIDAATQLGGTFYLPYQLYYSKEQLGTAYPEIDSFFETKKKYDPNKVFTNTWYETYSK